ncbi:MAG: alpha/beta hydrolase family protein [Aureispira sp.]
MKNLLVILVLVTFMACGSVSNSKSLEQVERKQTYQALRKAFKSSLIKHLKAPQFYDDEENLPPNISVVHYPSEGRNLKGLLHTSNIDSTKKTKALVYLHGGFALGYPDVTDCQPFLDAGYVVFAPAYRGENGNEGNFECFYGEVSDAENAVKWLSTQAYIDADQIFVFGHSIGGGVSALLSLNDNCPSKLNGSAAGLYFKESFVELVGKEKIPFDLTVEEEYFFRCPIYTLNYLLKKHMMYIGTDDYYKEYKTYILELYGTTPQNFKLVEIPGDHFSSLEPSMKSFLKEIEKML